MPRTLSEKRLIEKRRAQGILVPMLEEMAREGISLSPETKEDAEWVKSLILKTIAREDERGKKRVISPSALSSCLRLVYLRMHHQELGISPLRKVRTEAQGYFAKGNFTHLQWQFTLMKLSRLNSNFRVLEVDDIEPRGFEVRVASKKGDHAGTIDVTAEIFGEPFPIDIKGWNLRWFTDATRGNIPESARVQVGDYLYLANASNLLGGDRRFHRGIILAESKGGPTAQFPLALTDVVVNASEIKPEVKARLRLLREYEAEKEIPTAECQSTGSIEFQGCPFSAYCRKEVKEIQERRRSSEGSHTLKVARPATGGLNRSRRTRPKR